MKTPGQGLTAGVKEGFWATLQNCEAAQIEDAVHPALGACEKVLLTHNQWKA